MRRTICIAALMLLSLCSYALGELRLKTIVIDPGHGGKDPGAVSADKKTYEKTIVLDISRRLAAKIRAEYPDVKVVLTRDKDVFISLADRAEIANRANADLFISLHINAAASSRPNGYSLHLLGQSSNKDRDLFAYNMDVCKRENSVVMLENDATRYEGFNPDDPESQIFALLMQSAHLEQGFKFAETINRHLKGGPIKADRGIWQNPFYVLWKTSMPSVLVEMGFISNSTDLAVLRQESRREQIAQRLFEAFSEYKKSYDGIEEGTSVTTNTTQDSNLDTTQNNNLNKEEKQRADLEDSSDILYGTQIFAVGKLLAKSAPEFMGYSPVIIKSGNVNKYIIGVSNSLENAKKYHKSIKNKYSDAFLVIIKDGKTERVK